ncbi:DUF2442 domain-containing protein [Bythopirellula goksoeyrii]|uniref:DUF2442 domain-containing protein n=1 Tax=Bythopirellula goksoeyrii TaxID=1400387 RepID=UPI001AEFF7E9|nr:DUF2442 domain-containing protein [Bythopirellula goksoeyrii]
MKTVVAKDDHTLELQFESGEVGIYDFNPHLEFGIFQELKDLDYFRQARVENGTVAWPNEQDVCPDTLYEGSLKLANRDQS